MRHCNIRVCIQSTQDSSRVKPGKVVYSTSQNNEPQSFTKKGQAAPQLRAVGASFNLDLESGAD
jgi:hypothetical protein